MKHTILLILSITILVNYNLESQTFTPKEPSVEKLSTPHSAVYTHLKYLQQNSYDPKKAASVIDVDNPDDIEAQKLAIKLKKIFNGKKLYVMLDDIPSEPDYTDKITGKHKYVIFDELPEIYLVKKGNEWIYSPETVRAIPKLYSEIYSDEESTLEDILPGFAFYDFLWLKIWQWAGIIIYIFLTIIIFIIFRRIVGYYLLKVFAKLFSEDRTERYIKPLVTPFSKLALVFILQLSYPLLKLPGSLNNIIIYAILFLVPFLITFIAYRFSDLLGDIFSKIAQKTETTIDDNLVPFFRKILKIIIWIFGGIYILSNLGISITPLLAGISIGGIAFALAAQETIKNLFGSLTIFSDHPFSIGDWIIFDGKEGTVEQVGIRSTRIRTFANSQITIPNGKLADTIIDNMGRREYRRFKSTINITYGTKPDNIDQFVEGIRQIIAEHPDTWKENYNVYLNDLGASSLEILFTIFFAVPDYPAEMKSRHEIIQSIIKLADKLGVSFAFPSRSLYIESMPGKDL